MDREQVSNYEILPDVITATAKDLLAKGWDANSVAADLLEVFIAAMDAAGAKVVLLDQYVRMEHVMLVQQDTDERAKGEEESGYLRTYERYQASDSPQNLQAITDLLHANVLENIADGLLRDVCADIIVEQSL